MTMSTSKSKQKLSDRYAADSGKKSRTTHKGILSVPVIIGFALIVAVIGIVIITSISSKNSATGVSGYNVVVTPDNVDQLIAENTSKVAAGSYDVCMNSTWQFTDARSVSDNAYVENLISNSNTVNFTLTRNDTGATIYESPYIPVGSSLRNIKLTDESLSAGTYACTLIYHLVDDDYNQLSTLRIAVSVVIRNS